MTLYSINGSFNIKNKCFFSLCCSCYIITQEISFKYGEERTEF